MKTTILGPIAALVIGIAAGFIAGKNSAPDPEIDKDIPGDSRSARRAGPSGSSSGGAMASRGNRVKSASEAMSLPGQNNRLQALMDYYAGLDPNQFEEEAKKLEDLPWSERIMVGYLLFARWGEEDPTAAMAYTKTMGFAGMFVKGTVMQSWAAKYPQDAARYYTDNPNEFRMGGMMRGRGRGGSSATVIATEWARQDTPGAMAWAQTLEGRDKSDAMRGIFGQVAKEDPAKAASMLSTVTDEEARRDAQNTIAREWGGKDWDAATSWIAGLPADQQADATARAIRGLADEDPQLAATKITAVPEGEQRNDAVESIARRWGQEDPAAAAAWVMKTGSEEAQADSIGRVVSSWVGQDATEAYAFVQKQPEGAVRDKAASSYVMSNQGGDIQQNLQLAETIGDERTRHWAIGMTAASWARKDKEAATQYVESTESLSDSAKERIKQFSDRGWGRGRGRR
ncbi:MAG: hypothetical protein KJO79_04815 [Verrucomicrobiae bacterium]|nr:hypothetical protein [Verrucomicrobiae bacterium]NNJ86479.1 hypothetical protein [Akkermansiaceae bacterium]